MSAIGSSMVSAVIWARTAIEFVSVAYVFPHASILDSLILLQVLTPISIRRATPDPYTRKDGGLDPCRGRYTRQATCGVTWQPASFRCKLPDWPTTARVVTWAARWKPINRLERARITVSCEAVLHTNENDAGSSFNISESSARLLETEEY